MCYDNETYDISRNTLFTKPDNITTLKFDNDGIGTYIIHVDLLVLFVTVSNRVSSLSFVKQFNRCWGLHKSLFGKGFFSTVLSLWEREFTYVCWAVSVRFCKISLSFFFLSFFLLI